MCDITILEKRSILSFSRRSDNFVLVFRVVDFQTHNKPIHLSKNNKTMQNYIYIGRLEKTL